jgi:cyclopropane fatty-acyl-phospholipid synthase-like methyltransferase
MERFRYNKSSKYTDYDLIYAQCSGPGGLQLAEFMAEKMKLVPGTKLLDVGSNRGYHTCFLAKEYGVFAVGIDPWDDRMDGRPMVEHLRENAEKWGVQNSVMGIKAGVPETNFACSSFDYVYSTTALDMIRVDLGAEGYARCLEEIYRVLKPEGIFGLALPMHLDIEVPLDLEPYVSQEEYSWKQCFQSLREATAQVQATGFKIIEAEYAPDAWEWWKAFAMYDPFCKEDPEGDPKILEIDNGRWTSFGYVISRKPV